MIDDRPYCHEDDDTPPTCYELASALRGRATLPLTDVATLVGILRENGYDPTAPFYGLEVPGDPR
ncbi:hypothetical protein GCM10027436_88460 [Actinophytocola sediminis]